MEGLWYLRIAVLFSKQGSSSSPCWDEAGVRGVVADGGGQAGNAKMRESHKSQGPT
jgi:hypothetical protein